jgi:hypothetical protein
MTPEEPQDIDPGAYGRPSPVAVPVEARIAMATVRRSVVVAPVIVAVAWALRGRGGAAAAALGVAVVAANFLLSGLVMSRAAAHSLRAYHAAALLGFFVRLGLITLSMLLVAAVFEVDRPALGIAAVVAYLTLLTWEAWALTRSSGREYEWTN